MASVPDTSGEARRADILPLVPRGSGSNRSIWLFAIVLALAAWMLFSALSDRREQLARENLPVVVSGSGRIASPPPLTLPEAFPQPGEQLVQGEVRDPRYRRLPSPTMVDTFGPPPTYRGPPRDAPQALPPAPVPTGPSYVPAPTNQYLLPEIAPSATERDDTAPAGERVQARRLGNPSFTVPQGTVIPAVLETAIDSTRPGGVRAIVSRDVKGFDGRRVLIPRGSRLYGEYEADLQPGQKRALIRWTRLTRPDGVIIDLDSPAADPLGRAGVEGKVDNHFWQRFGDGLLNTTLNIGASVATRSIGDGGGVVVALPGSTQNIAGGESNRIQPTLTVKQGTSVSVMVARDLDFSSVDR